MALTNKPKKSKYQVGETVYFLSDRKGDSAEVMKVQSVVTNPDENSTGMQENVYYLEGLNNVYKEAELFHSMNALMFYIKGDYLMKLGNGDNIGILSGSNLSGCDFSYGQWARDLSVPVYFLSTIFNNCNFDGVNLELVTFTACDLTECSFRFANLAGGVLEESNILNSDFRGTNFTDAILPASANTKSSFKTIVGAGHWDPETTIWTDGLPIGN